MALFNFDSIEEFARAADSVKHREGASSWTAKLSYEQCVSRAISGDETYIARAEQMLDQLDVELPETKAFQTIHSPFGGRVNLGDWLAGSPDPMRRRKRVNTDIAPIKIVVSTTCSASVPAAVMEKRGHAILALLIKLQTVRPIQLYLLTELDGHIGWHHQVIRIESQPLALGVAAFGLCNVGFARHLTYNYAACKDGSHGSWPSQYSHSNPAYTNLIHQRCELSDDDLIIASAHSHDEMVVRPLEWIKEQLNRYANQEE